MKIVEPTEPPEGFDPAQQTPMRTAQVLRFQGITKLDIPVDRVLDGAMDEQLRCVVVLGYDVDGKEYFASSIADGADVLWLLERLKLRLLTETAETNEV